MSSNLPDSLLSIPLEFSPQVIFKWQYQVDSVFFSFRWLKAIHENGWHSNSSSDYSPLALYLNPHLVVSVGKFDHEFPSIGLNSRAGELETDQTDTRTPDNSSSESPFSIFWSKSNFHSLEASFLLSSIPPSFHDSLPKVPTLNSFHPPPPLALLHLPVIQNFRNGSRRSQNLHHHQIRTFGNHFLPFSLSLFSPVPIDS